MGWKDNVARRYTEAQIKVMGILSDYRVRYESEIPFPFSKKRGDLVVADVYLIESSVRVECDSEYFHAKKRDEEEVKDKRLLEMFKIETIRLDNHKIMLKKTGRRYVVEMLGLSIDDTEKENEARG